MSEQPQSKHTRLPNSVALAAGPCSMAVGHSQPVRIPYDFTNQLRPKGAFQAHFVRIPYRSRKYCAANLFRISAGLRGRRPKGIPQQRASFFAQKRLVSLPRTLPPLGVVKAPAQKNCREDLHPPGANWVKWFARTRTSPPPRRCGGPGAAAHNRRPEHWNPWHWRARCSAAPSPGFRCPGW